MADYEIEHDEEAPPQSSGRGIFLYVVGMLAALAAVALILIWYTGTLDREPPGLPPVTSLTPVPTPSATTSPRTPSGSPTIAVTARSGAIVVVGNTGGLGVRLRAQPSTSADVLGALPDGTRLEVVGADVQADGYTWKHVKDPSGRTGYIAANFVVAPQ